MGLAFVYTTGGPQNKWKIWGVGMSHAGDPGLLNWRPSSPLCAHGSHLEIKGITPQNIDSAVWGQCSTRSPLDMKKELLSYIT